MSQTGLLTIINLKNIASTLAATRKYALKTLYVQIHPQFRAIKDYKCTVYSSFITNIYTSSLTIFENNFDIRVLITGLKNTEPILLRSNVDYLFFDYSLKSSPSNDIIGNYFGSNVVELANTDFGIDHSDIDAENGGDLYDSVVLGGTFDRLHIGHKILLTEAALRTKKRLVVGVTSKNMIRTKKLTELILPVMERIQDVKDFLVDIDTSIGYTVLPIHDAYGPTATDEDLDLIVVSAETLKGADNVNKLRQEKNMKKLDVACIELISSDTTGSDKEIKISSSNHRMDLLGSRLKRVKRRPNLPARPYIIGLTGGVGSGKSKMGERFRELGAGVIDCDKLGHQLYEPGEDCYYSVIRIFGRGIVAPDGKIDRAKLGQIVFNSKPKLDELNELMWNAILTRMKVELKNLFENENKEIIIVEAAILIQAGWMEHCHEVWSCIIPPEMAVLRVVERNQISENEARKRVESQVDNTIVIQYSDVVFSTRWSYEFSQEQAERAWNNLLKMLQMQQ